MTGFVHEPFDSHGFRRVLGSFPTGVTVVTSRAPDGRRVGMTASSFNSVSLDPPLVLWSVRRKSGLCDVFSNAARWAIHVLSKDQVDLSVRFASNSEERFSGLALDEGLGGVPILAGCVGVLQCARYAAYDGGDHVIMVGKVKAFYHREGEPLLFHEGRYAGLSSATEQAYRALRSRIVSMRIPSGGRFKEGDLLGEIGLSAMAIREALDRLCAQGLVTAMPFGSYQVVPITPKHVKDSFDVLESIAPSLFSLAVRKASQKVVNDICRSLSDELRAWEAGTQTGDLWLDCCQRLFELMLEMADNEHYLALWRRMSGVNERLWRIAFDHALAPPAIAITRDFIVAVRERDHPTVMSLVQRFVQDSRDLVLSVLESASPTKHDDAAEHHMPCDNRYRDFRPTQNTTEHASPCHSEYGYPTPA
ncbi:flavin reductase [Bradyrhizobium sp. INPA03-11B]|uniref:flavin reductase n=1 Tax=Bradyrhizobium sp. INPA03-11B TaxID=418598 RepID=UPI00338D8509